MSKPANALPQRDELKDDLILPAYRQFCRDNGFNLQGCDIRLQAEAMALFNQLKPHYSFFRGHVVHFHVWSWDWDFLQTSQPVEEFLRDYVFHRRRFIENARKDLTKLLFLTLVF